MNVSGEAPIPNPKQIRLETVRMNVTSSYLGPFDTRRRGKYGGGSIDLVDRAITSMYKATFQFRLKGFNIVGNYMICTIWTTVLTFDFSSRAMIKMYVDANPTSMCDRTTWLAFLYTSWVDVPILFLSIGYILFSR